MSDCIFCKIAKGEIPSYTLYEDEFVRVFLDISPVSKGHTLIVPKKHVVDINDIDFETLKHIDETTKKMYPILKEKLCCNGITRIQNNEYGQEIKHYHLHLIPRYEGDKNSLPSSEEAKSLIEEIYKKF